MKRMQSTLGILGVMACFSILAGLAIAELETDIVTASNTVRQVAVGGTNYFRGTVAIGTNAVSRNVSLQTYGTASFEDGIVYVKPLGDVSMGSFTNK